MKSVNGVYSFTQVMACFQLLALRGISGIISNTLTSLIVGCQQTALEYLVRFSRASKLRQVKGIHQRMRAFVLDAGSSDSTNEHRV